jgi:hypothetical protein
MSTMPYMFPGSTLWSDVALQEACKLATDRAGRLDGPVKAAQVVDNCIQLIGDLTPVEERYFLSI